MGTIIRIGKNTGLAFPLVVFAFLPVSSMPASELQSAMQQGLDRLFTPDFSGTRQSVDAWQKLHPENPIKPVSHAADFLITGVPSTVTKLQVASQ